MNRKYKNSKESSLDQLCFDRNVKTYKSYLNYKYWTLSETVSILNGLTKFQILARITPEITSMFGRDFFGLIPNFHEKSEGITQLEQLILKALNNHEITAFPIRMESTTVDSTNDIMYYFYPEDVIVFAIMNGHQLPEELQIATGFFQIGNKTGLFKRPILKNIQRQAVAQAYRHKYPDMSIAEICRGFKRIKQFSRDRTPKNNPSEFDFIHDSDSKNREVVKSLISQNDIPFPVIPDVFKVKKGIIAFNFQRLKIVVRTITLLLILTGEKQILNHPLIALYSEIGGIKIKSLVEISLKSFCVFDIQKLDHKR